MTTSAFRVTVDGSEVGYVAHQDTAMMWFEGVEPTWEEARRSDRACAAAPSTAAPHRLAWAEVHDDPPPARFLYCPACKAIVLPPYEDGYGYSDYPAAWLVLVDEPPKSEAKEG